MQLKIREKNENYAVRRIIYTTTVIKSTIWLDGY